MNTAVKKLFAAALPMASKGELVPVPPSPPTPTPTLAQLAAGINADYADLTGSALTAVERAVDIGKKLIAAKAQISHGEFTGYVTCNFPFAMRWAQQCMKLASHESEVQQRLERMRSIGAHLSLAEAFKLIGSLNPKPKPLRRKRNPRAGA